MNGQTLQNFALNGIVAGVVLAFLAVVFGEIIGRPASEATRLYVFGLFTGLVGIAAGWLGGSKTADARTSALFLRQKETIDALRSREVIK